MIIVAQSICKIVTAVQLAWLKRPELGTTKLDVWETPTGELFTMNRGIIPKIALYPSLFKTPRGTN